jgi:PPP family 3-phenylpropionic acid transporter
MLSTKIFYFCFFAGLGALLPYLPLYYKQQGLVGWQIGVLTALPPLISLVAGPLWGAVADATRRHRGVLLLALVGTQLALLVIVNTHHFATMLPGVVLYACFAATIIPLIDSATLEILGERRGDYGRQRVWGTVGWMVIAPIASALAASHGLLAAFAVFWFFTTFAWLSAAKLPAIGHGQRTHFWTGLRVLVRERAWFIFLAVSLLGGMGLSLFNNFLFLYINHLGLNPHYQGWSMVCSTVSELPVMFYGVHLLRRIGPKRLIVLALLALVIRNLGCAAASSGWAILLTQCLHGISYGCLWIGGTCYAHRLAPPGLSATGQSLFNGITLGLGGALGSSLGGLVFQAYGPSMMFLLSGITVFLGLVLLGTLRRLMRPPAVVQTAQ